MPWNQCVVIFRRRALSLLHKSMQQQEAYSQKALEMSVQAFHEMLIGGLHGGERIMTKRTWMACKNAGEVHQTKIVLGFE